MTHAAALYQFFNAAIDGWSAYPETSVPSKAAGYSEDAAFPYLTYSAAFDPDEAREVSLPVNLWDNTLSEKRMNDAVLQLSHAIGRGGVRIPCDGGAIWLKRGTPFAQALQDEDPRIKRRYINLTAEYHLTADSD